MSTENLKITMYVLDKGNFRKMVREIKSQQDIMQFVGALCGVGYAEVHGTTADTELSNMAAQVVDCMMSNRLYPNKVKEIEEAEKIYQAGIKWPKTSK